MIRQVSAPVRFERASSLVVPLSAPTAPGTVIALAVRMVGGTAALRVFDAPGTPSWAWRCANDGRTALWYRAGARGGISEFHIAAAAEISGSAIAAEVAGRSPGQAVQLLCDLMAGQ